MTDAVLQYAGFWRRLGAFLADAFLYLALTTPLLVAAYGRDYFYWSSAQSNPFLTYGFTDLLLTQVVPLALIVFCWTRWGATPGKLLFDCRVVDARTLAPVSVKQALLRLLGYLVSAALFYLGFLWIAFDRRKQGLHDKLAGTLVLHAPADYAREPLDRLMAGWR